MTEMVLGRHRTSETERTSGQRHSAHAGSTELEPLQGHASAGLPEAEGDHPLALDDD